MMNSDQDGMIDHSLIDLKKLIKSVFQDVTSIGPAPVACPVADIINASSYYTLRLLPPNKINNLSFILTDGCRKSD